MNPVCTCTSYRKALTTYVIPVYAVVMGTTYCPLFSSSSYLHVWTDGHLIVGGGELCVICFNNTPCNCTVSASYSAVCVCEGVTAVE